MAKNANALLKKAELVVEYKGNENKRKMIRSISKMSTNSKTKSKSSKYQAAAAVEENVPPLKSNAQTNDTFGYTDITAV